jgi:hypothetical protein
VKLVLRGEAVILVYVLNSPDFAKEYNLRKKQCQQRIEMIAARSVSMIKRVCRNKYKCRRVLRTTISGMNC